MGQAVGSTPGVLHDEPDPGVLLVEPAHVDAHPPHLATCPLQLLIIPLATSCRHASTCQLLLIPLSSKANNTCQRLLIIPLATCRHANTCQLLLLIPLRCRLIKDCLVWWALR
jgi:hypothetical protein